MKVSEIPPVYWITPIVLSVPLIAMEVTDEVDWNLSDFLIFGLMLLVLAFFFDWIFRKGLGGRKRFGFMAIALLAFLLLWAELAVGIFGSPFAGS